MSNPRLTNQDRPSLGQRGLERVRGFFAPIGKFLARDLLSTFLLVASIVLLVLFFTLIGSLGSEGTGRNVPLSTVEKLAEGKRVREAELLDYDNQVVVTTDTGIQLYANYPSDGSATQEPRPPR